MKSRNYLQSLGLAGFICGGLSVFLSAKASVFVDEVLKGRLSVGQRVNVWGGENFICAQTHFSPMSALLFLKEETSVSVLESAAGPMRVDEGRWVGVNWQLSVRPIHQKKVDWYAGNDVLHQEPTDISRVLQEIRRLLADNEASPFLREHENSIAAYLMKKNRWERSNYRLEDKGPASDGKYHIVYVFDLKSVKNQIPGSGPAIVLNVDENGLFH